MEAIKLITCIPAGILIYFIGRWFTYDSKFINKIRNKYKILARKPFNCTECFSTWLFIFYLFMFRHDNLLDYITNIIISYIFFIIVSKKENKNNYNISIEDKKTEYKINKSVYINQNGDERYNLKINVDGIEIINLDFNSVIERETYINNWKRIFKIKE